MSKQGKDNNRGTDIEWEKWGQRDPYFGVLAHEKFRRQNLTEEALNEFFESGKKDVLHVLKFCRRHFDSNFSPKRVLDFGCGVGRLVIPFAGIADHVWGIDVSDSMLQAAVNNCNKYFVKNASLLKSDDDNLSALEDSFDLIHSFIVFQHLPIDRGRQIFVSLLKYLNDGGIGAIQFTYSKSSFRDTYGVLPTPSILKRFVRSVKKYVRNLLFDRLRYWAGNQSSELKDPEVQMNPYNLNELFFILQCEGIQETYVEFTDHAGELGVYLYFRKPKRV
ncbi:MAG: class I SAM-dependent methyltransferase [Oscillatoriales cyanobacterium SM2_1_8]|nr:class I SAM-dependent methyltransferase [Oscillatoriales cyanobacterium SM2_1_8]